jgi:hypothetical protein
MHHSSAARHTRSVFLKFIREMAVFYAHLQLQDLMTLLVSSGIE